MTAFQTIVISGGVLLSLYYLYAWALAYIELKGWDRIVLLLPWWFCFPSSYSDRTARACYVIIGGLSAFVACSVAAFG